MSNPEAMAARENSLRLHEEETLRETRPYLSDTEECDYK